MNKEITCYKCKVSAPADHDPSIFVRQMGIDEIPLGWASIRLSWNRSTMGSVSGVLMCELCAQSVRDAIGRDNT